MDLNHLWNYRHIPLKLSGLNPISTHSIGNQTELKNVTLEEKQPQYMRKKRFSKTILSQETKKVTNSITDTNNKSISETDNFLRKIKSVFISAADIVLKRIFVIKISWKNVNSKNGSPQIVN